jgi:transcriptional regulator with XRE-family HTH domain
MTLSFDHVRKILAQNIRALKDEGQLSQEELALRADVDRTYVSQIERGLVIRLYWSCAS